MSRSLPSNFDKLCFGDENSQSNGPDENEYQNYFGQEEGRMFGLDNDTRKTVVRPDVSTSQTSFSKNNTTLADKMVRK